MSSAVILMALSNISGEEGEYTHRSMHLLATDQATILCGITSAASTGAISAIFFSIGVCYGICTFYFALQVGRLFAFSFPFFRSPQLEIPKNDLAKRRPA